MLKMYNMSEEERDHLGQLGQKHVEKNYSFEKFNSVWPSLLKNIHEKFGSWENRKNYKSWHLMEIE